MEEMMIKVENVSKQYRLGQIGGTTLKEEIQRKIAKMRGKEDPTKKIGERDFQYGETFMALDGVSFDVKKGERIGIIGHNGAGKSTLLKLLSRVTAPSEGAIGMNGRIASMLEVGTGFHGELTGRENVYMNGAILGMTRKEVDSKIDDIIEFSEVRQFIDTPVKRYSSGMYVKLAFSVAAHLDSEIMIMDEVLAVGDVAFQTKCLNKMNEVSKSEGRTILYVSHNMNTVRQLCNRCIVLDHGKIVFDGAVDEGIAIYIKTNDKVDTHFNVEEAERPYSRMGVDTRIFSLDFLKERTRYKYNETIDLKVGVNYKRAYSSLRTRAEIYYFDGTEIGIYESETYVIDQPGSYYTNMRFTPDILPNGKYYIVLDIYELDVLSRHWTVDHPSCRFYFDIFEDDETGIKWEHEDMGHVRMGKLEMENI
ncbi:MAG: ABC transporter ATP-binding protein [Bacillus sp. (in: firmicutes)]